MKISIQLGLCTFGLFCLLTQTVKAQAIAPPESTEVKATEVNATDSKPTDNKVIETMTQDPILKKGASFDFFGEFFFDFVASTRPTSEAGNNSFKLPQIKLNFEKEVRPDTTFIGAVQFGPERVPSTANSTANSTVGQFRGTAEEAYIRMPFFSENYEIKLGLIPYPWLKPLKTSWIFSDFTDNGTLFLEKFGYVSRSDLGLSIQRKSEKWLWYFTLVNGEGISSDETYAGKDTTLHFEYTTNFGESILTVHGLYSYGIYDNLNSVANNTKDRTGLAITYQKPNRFIWTLEGYMGKDPVDAITQIQAKQISFAEFVDLSSQGGKQAFFQGGSTSVRIPWRSATAEKWEFIEKLDHLNPMQSFGKWVTTSMTGIAYMPNEKVMGLFSNNHNWYSEPNYGNGRRESDKWYISTRFLF